MEGLRSPGFDGSSVVMKKRRSNTSRRPRPDAHLFLDGRDISPSSSTPPSDNVGRGSSDENAAFITTYKRKEMNLSSSSRFESFNKDEGGTFLRNARKGDGVFDKLNNSSSSRAGSLLIHGKGQGTSDFKRCSEGVLAPANWNSSSKSKDNSEFQSRNLNNYSSTGTGNERDFYLPENKLRKVKLKVGGVTRTIHAKSSDASQSDGPRQRQKLILQENSDDDSSPQGKANGSQENPWKHFSRGSNTQTSKDPKSKSSEKSASVKQSNNSHGMPSSETVRKSKRVPKKRVLDGAFDDGDEDDEIRYLERLKTAKISGGYGVEHDDLVADGKKQKTSKSSRNRISNSEYDDDVMEYGASRMCKKKSRSERESEDTDYVEEEEGLGSDVGSDGSKRKKQKKEPHDSLTDGKKEITLTSRQRALQLGKDASAGAAATSVEFPNGLPPAPSRKQKEKLSEVELQLKKAEAAQRRRMQVEKAARESEAEAIRKILGQDSSRKKREDKLRKRRDELAQEKAANSMMLAANTVRWVMGPTGTVVTFPKEVGLPSIFDSKPCSYPPPREKCAGPSCTNAYKYRDSKSKLPLCSLQCYKAIHAMMQPVTTC